MADHTVTASAESTTYSNPGMHVAENFEAVLASGLDEVYKRDMDDPESLRMLFRERSMDKRTINFQSHIGLSTVGQNRDAEALPYDTKGLGFGWSLTADTFRGAISIEKELKEDELYGAIADLQSELVGSAAYSRELVMADVFNRALGTSGAPFVCEDGMYFIDSARPNPSRKAGSWSNLESSISSVTPNGIFNVQLNYSNNEDERGRLKPLKLKTVLVRPNEEKQVWEIVKSDKRPTDAMNAANYQLGRFDYKVLDRLTTASIFYLAADPKGSKNELIFGNRKAPQLETWKDGSNPDITRQRIRMRFGVGAGRPYIWRGGAIS